MTKNLKTFYLVSAILGALLLFLAFSKVGRHRSDAAD